MKKFLSKNWIWVVFLVIAGITFALFIHYDNRPGSSSSRSYADPNIAKACNIIKGIHEETFLKCAGVLGTVEYDGFAYNQRKLQEGEEARENDNVYLVNVHILKVRKDTTQLDLQYMVNVATTGWEFSAGEINGKPASRFSVGLELN